MRSLKNECMGTRLSLGLLFLVCLLLSFFAYEPNRPVSAKENSVKMRISIILVRTIPEAQSILKDLSAGANFAELARRFSIGPGKEEGGDVGYFAPGDMQEELDSVAVNLKIGEFSRIIETGTGYFILLKTEENFFSEAVTTQAQGNLWKELAAKFRELYQQGRYSEAEIIAGKTLEVGEDALGPEHPEVAASLNNLGELYRAQGRHTEAEPLYRRALAIREKALGPEHPEVGTSLNNLAELYRAQGRHTGAEPLYKRALAIMEKARGPEHPEVAASLNNLAELYRAQGKYAEAESLYKQALAIVEKAVGPEHPNVATSHVNLAMLYENQGKYDEAEPFYKQSLAIREKTLGPEHPHVAAVLGKYAYLAWKMKRYLDAAKMGVRANFVRAKHALKNLAK
jgi:tetratricopeptide (TPR) repeat protein